MKTDEPLAKEPRFRGFLQGISAATTIGSAIGAVLLATIVASAWWAWRAHYTTLRDARFAEVRSAGDFIANSAETMLRANEISALRSMLANATYRHKLQNCRIVLPDGQVIADGDPALITLRKLEKTWEGTLEGVQGESLDDKTISLTYPLYVIGRGQARLEIAASSGHPRPWGFGAQSGIGLIGVAAFVALLLICRYARSQGRAIEAIRQALLSLGDRSNSSASLAVRPHLGAEVEAWNKLLTENDTLRKQTALERAKESFEAAKHGDSDLGAACDAMSQGMILVDEEMRVRYANGAAGALLRVKHEQIVGADIGQSIDDERVLEATKVANSGSTSRRAIVEVDNTATGGGVLRFIVRPVRREDTGVVMIIIDDITQQRVAQEARDSFLAQATHELRTPLTNIRLYVETALDEGQDDKALQAQCLNVINQESSRLERTVSDILSVSQIEAGSFKINRDDVRLDTLFDELKADYDAQAKEKEIDLAFDLPPKLPVLQADRDKISLAVHNLIGNALKYTPKSGRVTVSAEVASDRVVIDVADTGLGMSEDDAGKVFEKFYRSKDPRIAKITGSGLGLALAREVIRLHGGDITVQSELDKGSTFSLTLPKPREVA